MNNKDAILKELKCVQMSIECINSQFENVVEPDLIDSCIYQLNAAYSKYTYLLRMIKELK